MRDKSDENWRVGNACLVNGDLNAAANRLYYAVYQAVRGYALAKEKDYRPSDTGDHRKMEKIIRRYGKSPELSGDTFQDLMELRGKADYGRETPDASELHDLLPEAGKIRDYYLKRAEN